MATKKKTVRVWVEVRPSGDIEVCDDGFGTLLVARNKRKMLDPKQEGRPKNKIVPCTITYEPPLPRK